MSYVAGTFLKPVCGYDDSLDVFGVHALGGTWGALASGIFAVTLGAGVDTNAQQVLVQIRAIAFVAVFAPLATLAILVALRVAFGSLRASEEAEFEGLDLSDDDDHDGGEPGARALGQGDGRCVRRPLAGGRNEPAGAARPLG